MLASCALFLRSFNGSGYEAFNTYVTCSREPKDEKEAHGKSVLLDTVGLIKSALRAVTPHLRKQWRGLFLPQIDASGVCGA